MTNDNALTPSAVTPPQAVMRDELYRRAVAMVIASVSASSARVYEQGFQHWEAYAEEQGFHPLSLSPEHVMDFVNVGTMAKSTRQRHLSFMRSLVKALYVVHGDEQWQRLGGRLKMLRVRVDLTEEEKRRRTKKALKPQEVYEAFNTWRGDGLTATRNRALLAVAFYAGLRRAEIIALQWGDVDLERGILTVRHGKGDKPRETVLVSEVAVDYLQAWQTLQTITAGEPRRYVFCALVGRGRKEPDALAADKPMTPQGLYKIIRQSGDFAPHDARRTLITNLLENGVSVADAQAQAGHANPATTLHYAQKADALTRKGRLKVNY